MRETVLVFLRMKNRLLFCAAVFLTGFTFLGVRTFTALGAANNGNNSQQDDSAYSAIQVFTYAMQLIRQDYVDDKKISYRDLTNGALHGMLATLDPHSRFMENTDFKEMQIDTKSQFGGIGVTLSSKDGNIVVVAP